MNNKMYEIVAICLDEIEKGADVDTLLFRYPDYADDLRPILEASVKAMDMAVEPSIAMLQVNRSKLLQRAAEMREAKAKPITGVWFASLRRLAVAALIMVMVFVSGTGLVRAASNTIPGDNLYPVKRTWEDILLLLTFNTQQREAMEFKHENERLNELNELFAAGRSVKVDFSGYVTHQYGNEWRVSGITVILSPQTVMPNQPVGIGAAVRIVGMTQTNKTVLADMIALLPAGIRLPEMEDNGSESESENHEVQTPEVEDASNSGSENEAPPVEATQTPNSDTIVREVSFEGILESFDGNNIWTVNGQPIDVSSAEINGNVVIGAEVKVEGYRTSSGIVIAKKVEVLSSPSDGSKSNDDGQENSNDDDSNDDHSNDNNTNGESHD